MFNSSEELWQLVLEHLSQKISAGVLRTWVFPNRLTEVQLDGEVLVCIIESPTSFHLSMVEKSLKQPIVDALQEITQQTIRLEFRIGAFSIGTKAMKNSAEKLTHQNVKPLPQNAAPLSPSTDSLFSPHTMQQAEVDFVEQKLRLAGLNLAYTFESFAVSSTNEMAHAAAVAVSQNPGKAYNVLFLYGGVGVGKTHLMQAVGQNILRAHPDSVLLYRTGEEFMNEIVEAIQSKKTVQMKHRYRSVQTLLIDDIQFMAGKRTMQEEFFHTFNSVLKTHGQVILTSDRPPHEISPLDDRIQSRLEGGLIIDIQQPSFELRTAIVLIKAKQFDCPIGMEHAQKIAATITSTRKLEGVVKAVHSEHLLMRKPITAELISSILSQLQQNEDGTPQKIKAKPLDIIKTISNQYHIKMSELRGPKRTKHITTARHVAMYILKTHLDLPLMEIGHYFGSRDHTSVMHAVKKIDHLRNSDLQVQTEIQAIETSLLPQ